MGKIWRSLMAPSSYLRWVNWRNLGRTSSWMLLSFGLLGGRSELAKAQSIIPSVNGAGTIVMPNGNQITITGGTISQDGINLFHRFQQFGLDQNQTAIFLSNPAIQNILGQIVGGDPSIINGLIQVTGGNSNLYLINPAGFIFGSNARLNLPASFAASTASRIGFGDQWLNVLDSTGYANLLGSPISFGFDMIQPGAIVNAGNLAVPDGHNLTLLGGTVVSTGSLAASGGQITLATVPGENLVRLNQPENWLNLQVVPLPSATLPTFPSFSLSQLLTDVDLNNITGLRVNSDGQTTLAGSNILVGSGDVVTRNLVSRTATLSAINNLTLVESQLYTTGDLNLLANQTVFIRDSVANPFVASTGGNLYIQGNQSIDILALSHLHQETPFQSGGSLRLVSDGNVSGDAHFASGRQFSILNLSGQPGKFVSLYDPIISANGNVQFGDYSGVSLKIEATGSIQGGNITITSPDITLISTDPDANILRSGRSLVLRAGLATLVNPANLPQLNVPEVPTSFTLAASDLPRGSIQVGRVHLNKAGGSGNAGQLIFAGTGDITTGDINDGLPGGSGNLSNGPVTITTQGNITVGTIFTDNFGGTNRADAAPITLIAGGSVRAGQLSAINTDTFSGGGDISISAQTRITTGDISTGARADRSGAIKLSAGSDITTGNINTNWLTDGGGIVNANGQTSGDISVSTPAQITTGDIDTSAELGKSGAIKLSDASDIITGNINAIGVTGSGDIRIKAKNTISFSNSLITGSSTGVGAGTLTLDAPASINLPAFISTNGASVTIPLVTIVDSGSIINTGGGAFTLNASTDLSLSNAQISTQGGRITINSSGNLFIGNTLDTSSTTGRGGDIDLRSGRGIQTVDLTTTGVSGGNVSVIAPISITTGNINASGFNGSGGNVLLDPLQDVQVGWINAQGGANGSGGNVDIVSIQGFFRSNSSFSASNGANTSISTIGGLGGGSITITHNGGDRLIPFNVTNLSRNGTQGILTTGSESIVNGIFPGPYQQGNIRLITSPRFTTLLADSLLDGNPRDRLMLETGGTLFPLEEKFTREFDKDAKVLTLEEMQSTLRKVEDNVGVRPALIYVSYASVPTSMPENCTPGEMVKDEQNPGKMKACACKDVILPHDPNGWENITHFEALPCDRLTLTLVTSSGAPEYIPLSKAPRHQVEAAAFEFRSSIEKRNGKDEYKPISQRLYGWLVEPLQQRLQEKKIGNLSYLMPDRLRLVPFAALLDKEDKFLIETYSTGLMPSLSLVDTRKVEIKQRFILALGLSEFASNQGQSPLSFTEQEIDEIPKPWTVIRLRNEEVTFSQLSQQTLLGIVHFATHGDFSDAYPKGMIQLWDEKLVPQRMKQLDWYNPSQPAIELMVLSACNTAYGKNGAELGFAGAAHRFGVKSVMGSLWLVRDESTSTLMQEFYTFLKTEPTKADALAKAQQALLKYKYEPFHWSAFTLIGNPW